MITTEMIYWIIMLDNITMALSLGSIIAVIIMGAWTIGMLIEEIRFHWSYAVALILSIFIVLSAIFVPNSKQMATIYVLPKIVNNEKVQSLGNRTLDTGDKLLALVQQYLTEKISGGADEKTQD